MKTLKFLIVVLGVYLCSSISISQNKWSAEFRPNINFPTADIEDSNVKVGSGFELAIGYRFMEHLGAYVGWGYNNFKIEDSDVDFDVTGYTFGLQFIHPLGTSESLSYLLRVGAIYNHIELEDSDGNLIDDSGHDFGWEVGIGLNYVIGADWSLRPQIGYRGLSTDLDITGSTSNVDINYLAFGLGISKTF